MVTVQELAPLHAPDQLLKVYPLVGDAVSVTDVPWVYVVEQVEPQEMPAGLLVTVPFGEVTDRVYVVVGGVPALSKIAVTVWFAFTVTVHVLVPEHAPVQPEKVELLAGVAVKVTLVPVLTAAEHVAPQAIEPPETVPNPVPVFMTDRV